MPNPQGCPWKPSQMPDPEKTNRRSPNPNRRRHIDREEGSVARRGRRLRRGAGPGGYQTGASPMAMGSRTAREDLRYDLATRRLARATHPGEVDLLDLRTSH